MQKAWKNQTQAGRGAATWKPQQKTEFLFPLSLGGRSRAVGLGEGGGSAQLHRCPAHPDSDKRCRGGWAASGREPGAGGTCKGTPRAELPGPGRQTPSPISCPLFSMPLAQELHQKKAKKKIPSAECESQTHGTKAGTAPGPPACSPVCWEATRFRETGSPEITEAGSTWLAGGRGAGGAPSTPPPHLHSPALPLSIVSW